jgi:uncharacterized membrane protein YraQ (UPF0718 family)
MSWSKEWKPLLWMVALFGVLFYLPVGTARFDKAIFEALHLAKWYAQEHVLLCLIPAFFIAGAIGVFVRKDAIMKYLGPKANKVMAYGVASVSGTILAVCSCTVLPLFSGIWRMGAGLGPASAFLYSGPAINVLAIIMTARVLGPSLGLARAIGAVVFSIVIGLAMHFIFRKEEKEKADVAMAMGDAEEGRPLWQTALFFASMVAILVFANWGKPDGADGFFAAVHAIKWPLTLIASAGLYLMLALWFKLALWKIAAAALPVAVMALVIPDQHLLIFAVGVILISIVLSLDKGESGEWFSTSWDFAKQIFPLLIGGVIVAGILLGRPGHEGLIPSEWIAWAVGGNSLAANFFASIAGAFMYFATLTEVPILQGLIGSGMGQGPALALLLAGPALSLPSMLVLNSIMGFKKTAVFITLVVILSTLAGYIYGML